jgi:predicted phosphodiesterase
MIESLDETKLLKMKKFFLACILAVNILVPGKGQEIKFGVIADIHHGFLTDVDKRLQKFIDVCEDEKVDFIIQLGDFTLYMNRNQSGEFMDIWNSYEGPRYHVIGNHELDYNTKQQVIDYWNMPGNYYTFNMNGFHFVVMDENFIKQSDGTYIDYANGNYFRMNRDWFGEKQLEWFRQDLAHTEFPTVKFSHAHRQAKDRVAVESIISEANTEAGYKKVLLSLNGHGHSDVEEVIDNVPYIEIPTASHKWNGEEERAEPYTTVRFAIVTMNAKKGTLVVDGYSLPVEYQQGLPSHVGTITDRSYTFQPLVYGCRDSLYMEYNQDVDVHIQDSCRTLNEGVIDIVLDTLVFPKRDSVYSSSEEIGVRIINAGSCSVDTFPMYYQINDLPSVFYSPDTILNPGDTGLFFFPQRADMSDTGTYVITVYVTVPGDAVKNDTLTVRLYNTILGKKELAQFTTVMTYPNPVEDMLSVRFSSREPGSWFNLAIMDMKGKTLLQKRKVRQNREQEINISIQMLPSGTYLLLLYNNKERIPLKFVKK